MIEVRTKNVLDDILTCERAVWEALVDGNEDADRTSLHETFIGVYPSGFASRDDHVAQLSAGPTVATYELSQERVLELGPDYACLSYFARYQRPTSAHWEEMYVSSIWQRVSDGIAHKWVNIFSQDTPATGAPVV